MTVRQKILRSYLRYLWWVLSLALIFYIISQNIITTREITYQLDFSQNRTANTRGWYPEVRTDYDKEGLAVRAEPIYYQVYIPADFQNLNISGSLQIKESEDIRLGLRQKDGSWQWQDVISGQVNLDFDLTQAQIKNNRLELIMSIPNLNASSSMNLIDNWQIKLNR